MMHRTSRGWSLIVGTLILAACGERKAPAPPPADSGAVVTAAATDPCLDFTDDAPWEDADLKMTRASGWLDATDLGGGKWLGRLENKKTTPAGDIPGGRKGCYRIQRAFNSSTGKYDISSTAYLSHNGQRIPQKQAAICWGPPHPLDVKPRWGYPTDPCPYLESSVVRENGQVISWVTRAATDSPTDKEIEDALVESAANQKITVEVARALARQYTAWFRLGGPWYPCALTGCCRAY